MAWQKVADIDSPKDEHNADVAEYFPVEEWDEDLRMIEICQEEEWHIEIVVDNELSGWQRIAEVDYDGEFYHILETTGNIDDDDFRIVYDYTAGEYSIEKKFE